MRSTGCATRSATSGCARTSCPTPLAAEPRRGRGRRGVRATVARRADRAARSGRRRYAAFLREPILTWGATAEEAAGGLPGDELQPDSDGVATRAIWIDAPADAVWPWLAQMGPAPRGGAYTYDWIENAARSRHAQRRSRAPASIQHPQVRRGDRLRLQPHAPRARGSAAALAWRSSDGNWVWLFVAARAGRGARD